jgi:hypothetical protein
MGYLTSGDCFQHSVLIEAWGGQLRGDLATGEHQDAAAERC